MDKVILVYPDTLSGDSALIMPLSLLYVATPIWEHFRVKIVDQRIDKDWRRTLRNEINKDRTLCAGISSMTGPQILGGLEAAEIIRQAAPEVPIVWGGVHPSLLPEETIREELVDIVVIGDGENIFRELVEVLQRNGDKKQIKGIFFQDGDTITRTPEAGQFPIGELGTLAYDLLDVEQYKSTPLWTIRESLPIITSRGCPHRCGYCYNTQFSQRKWTRLSAEQTVSSIIHLTKRYDVSGVFLLDDNFFVNLGRVRHICELLLKYDIDVHIYNANCRVDTIVRMDLALLRILKRAGFHQIYVGVESGSDNVLEKIGKEITVKQILEASRRLKEVGIRPFYSFMAGFPFETIEDMKKTLVLMSQLLKENKDAIVYRLQLFTPYPGTDLFQKASRLGMEFPKTLRDWAHYHYDTINYNGLSSVHRKFLEDYQYYTTFLDKKLTMDQGLLKKAVSTLYSHLLSLRIAHGAYSSVYELYPLRMGRKIRQRLSGKC